MTHSTDNIFYYNPGSVFSNIGVLLLCEKGVQDQFDFKPVQMGIDNIKPWYIRLNPKGQVPILVHQGKAIPDSLAIAGYLDTHFGDKPAFGLDDTQVTTIIEQWRQVRVLSQLSGKKTKDQNVLDMRNTLDASRQKVIEYMRENPDLTDQYTVRLSAHDDRAHMLVEHESYLLHQDRLNAILFETENALKVNEGYLLSSKKRTAADLYVTGILFWLHAKLNDQILSKRPFLDTYYKQQQETPTFKAFLNQSKST